MKKYSLIIFLLLYVFNYKIFAAKLTLESPAFKLNTIIATQYTCNGDDKSPPLAWSNIPPKTQSLVLLMEDPDAPDGTWTHWVLFNIPPTLTGLDVGAATPEGAANAKNSWGSLIYRGPCPTLGMHRYVFKLYAVDKVLTFGNGATKDAVLDAITGHTLGNAELAGLYQK